MKKTTERQIQQSEHFLSRCFIDRVRNVPTAILADKRKIIKEAQVMAAYLYDYYISICKVPIWDLTDDAKIAKQIGLTVRQVSDNRRLLTKLGWIRLDTHTHKGIKYGLWYIGKEVVAAKFNADTPLEEFNALGILTDEELARIQDGLVGEDPVSEQ